MNKKQLTVLWIGIAAIVLMGIFPPWQVMEGGRGAFGYCFILRPPGSSQSTSIARFWRWRVCLGRLDTSCLFIQWAMVAMITGGLIITLKDKKRKDE